MSESFEKISDLIIERDVSAKTLTTFKSGGTVKLVLFPTTPTALAEAIKQCEGKFVILGNGSNVLLPDGDYTTPLICTVKMRSVTFADGTVTAACGVNVTAFASKVASYSLEGFEFLYGIPGSVGGAVMMNAGAYGSCIADVLNSVTVCSKTGELGILSAEECDLSYRHSRFFQSEETVVSATFNAKKGDPRLIKEKMEDLMAQRRSKQPLEYPSAGSYFKRPEGYFAGKLIEDAGLKSLRVGGAMVSEKHAGFIINYDNASTEDIIKLEEKVRKEVFEKFGVLLQCEVRKL